MEIIDKHYKTAIKGLNEVILKDKHLWYYYVVQLPIHLQVVYTISIFHQQVFNGGFHQYFFNSYGQFAHLTVDNLQLIKAFKTATILEKALNEVNYEQLNPVEFREKIFNRQIERIMNFDETLGDVLDDLDDEYDSLDEDLEQLLVNYLNNIEGTNHH